MKRLLRVQPAAFISTGHLQLIHCLEPAFLSSQPSVVALLCDVLTALYSAFNVGGPELPQEVKVRPAARLHAFPLTCPSPLTLLHPCMQCSCKEGERVVRREHICFSATSATLGMPRMTDKALGWRSRYRLVSCECPWRRCMLLQLHPLLRGWRVC